MGCRVDNATNKSITSAFQEKSQNRIIKEFAHIMVRYLEKAIENSEEIAYPVLFLATEFADMITGYVPLVDGGWTIK